jgi:hypothetical protein
LGISTRRLSSRPACHRFECSCLVGAIILLFAFTVGPCWTRCRSKFIPILLGNGILVEDLDPEGIELRRTGSIETPGATHVRFEVAKV